MNGNIYRADMHFYYSADFVLSEVGKGNIVAEQKRKSGIIVFKVKTFSHSFRELVYKAENAFVSARMLFIHKIGFKFKTDFFIFALSYRYFSLISRHILNKKLNLM